MARFLSAFSLFLACFPAFAEIATAAAATEQSSIAGFVLFSLLFVAMCAGFVWLIIWNDRKQKAKEGKE